MAVATEGNVIQTFGGGQHASKGIDIAGKSKQPVFSSLAGEVVYSGNGLVGYGNLIIVKHSSDYLSAYAYNAQNLVKEGAHVKRGQKIALMGAVRHKPQLHFEIRKNGKPVNPVGYLHKK